MVVVITRINLLELGSVDVNFIGAVMYIVTRVPNVRKNTLANDVNIYFSRTNFPCVSVLQKNIEQISTDR